MKLTNKHGIPQTFVNVLERPTYSKGKAHLSVTQLINSPKIVALTKKFDDELEQESQGKLPHGRVNLPIRCDQYLKLEAL